MTESTRAAALADEIDAGDFEDRAWMIDALERSADVLRRAAALIRELSPDPAECLCYGAGIAWNCRAHDAADRSE